VTSPLFSVIMPTYGRSEFLDEALSSVLAQTVDDFECLVIDDASPEPASVRGDPRIRLIRRTENGGPGAARNTGLAHARGRYITFLDDDDLYTRDRLALALEGLERAPVAICWNGYFGARRRGRTVIDRNRSLEGDVSDIIMDDIPPHLGATSLQREAAIPFDERFEAIQDVEWWLRLATRAKVTTVPRIGYLLRKHATPRHRTGLSSRVRCSLLLFEVHASYFRAHPRGTAHRWKRIGLAANDLGDYALARTAFARSLRLHPSIPMGWHLVRSVRVSTSRVPDSYLTRFAE
jgi:glycosyltransferase involved in cell wall biosynthesis